MLLTDGSSGWCATARFNGHPPLGVNATVIDGVLHPDDTGFNGHPPLGVNATLASEFGHLWATSVGFNGHPPLGVNATAVQRPLAAEVYPFQRAPTLGGECYRLRKSFVGSED